MVVVPAVSNCPITTAKIRPAARAMVSLNRSWAWNCNSGRRSLAAMQTESARREAELPEKNVTCLGVMACPQVKQDHAQGYHQGKRRVHQMPQGTRPAAGGHQRADRQRVKGLCRKMTRKVPNPRNTPAPPWASASTLAPKRCRLMRV